MPLAGGGVSEAFEARPEESWVMGQEVGRDMLTLQTCIPPTFEERLVVRADRAYRSSERAEGIRRRERG